MTDVTADHAGLEPTHVQALTDAADALTVVVAAYERGVGDALDAVEALSGEDARLALLAGAALIADLRRDRSLPEMPAGSEAPPAGGTRNPHVWADPGPRR